MYIKDIDFYFKSDLKENVIQIEKIFKIIKKSLISQRKKMKNQTFTFSFSWF